MNTAEGFDTDVAEFACRAVNAAPEFSVEDDSAADARAERNHNDGLASAPSALPHLADRRRVRVVLNYRRPLQLIAQSICETKVVETGNVRHFHHDSLIRPHCSGNDDRHRANLRAALMAFTLARRSDDGAHDLFRLCGLRRALLGAFVNAPLAINRGRAQIRPAEVGGNDEFILRAACGSNSVGFVHISSLLTRFMCETVHRNDN